LNKPIKINITNEHHFFFKQKRQHFVRQSIILHYFSVRQFTSSNQKVPRFFIVLKEMVFYVKKTPFLKKVVLFFFIIYIFKTFLHFTNIIKKVVHYTNLFFCVSLKTVAIRSQQKIMVFLFFHLKVTNLHTNWLSRAGARRCMVAFFNRKKETISVFKTLLLLTPFLTCSDSGRT
jgi:hypothetical protein